MEADGPSKYRSYLNDKRDIGRSEPTGPNSTSPSAADKASSPRSNFTKDIGQTPLDVPPTLPTELDSIEQIILRQIRDVIGDEPVSLHRLQFAPQWMIDKAIKKKMDNFAEKGAYEEVHLSKLPRNVNLISSHCFFQIKMDGTASRLKLKCRLVPHGNRDQEKDNIRKDSVTAQFPAIRLLLSTAAVLGFRLGTIDISGAYLQAGSLQRDVYVRLPRGWTTNNFIVWKLLVPAYGLVESGRLWQLAVEEWMHDHYGLSVVLGLAQLFVLRNRRGEITLLIAKVVDDFLLAGTPEAIHSFHNTISKRFKVGRFIFDRDLVFNRLHISQNLNGSIIVSMKEYLEKIEAIEIPRYRRKQVNEKATQVEFKALLGSAGKLNWLGHGIMPSAAYAASLLQQWTGSLHVHHLIEANKVLHEIRQLNPVVRYNAPSPMDINSTNPCYLAFTDASQGNTSYGQTGYVSGVYFPSSNTYHVIDWHSSKQTRVCFSSIGAEIIAAAEGADRGSLMTTALQDLHQPTDPLPLVLTVNSHGLYSTITTLHEGRDYRLRPTVSRLRDSFESQEIAVIQWIKGPNNLADALTKRNLNTFKKLNEACSLGHLPSSTFTGTERVLFTQ